MGVWYQTTALHLHICVRLHLSLLLTLSSPSLSSPSLSSPLSPPPSYILPTFFSSTLIPPPLLPPSSGKYIIEGQMLRAKAQLDQLHSNIASVARKTGISSATKLALLGPSREGREEDIPLVEWWDAAILPNRR